MARAAWRRGGSALVGALLVAGPLSGVCEPAGARPAAACTGSSGVTVVVDFGTLGGGVQIRCVTQSVTSGFDALRKAGFTYDPTVRFGGLLCRIDGKPADDPCVSAPPPDRYWAYWTAPAPGGAWTYSDTGAGNRVPPPGSVEGWAFSDGCDRRPASGPCPTGPTTTTRLRATTTTLSGGSGGGRGRTTPTTPTPGPTDPGGGATTSTPPDGSTTTSTTTTAADERAPAAGETVDDDELALSGDAALADRDPPDDGGSPAGVVTGLLAALALVLGAAVTARRRRTGEAGP